jgi:hypothetical protein
MHLSCKQDQLSSNLSASPRPHSDSGSPSGSQPEDRSSILLCGTCVAWWGQCLASSTGAFGSTPRSGRGGSEFESQVGDFTEVDRMDEDTVSKTAAAKHRCRFDSCGLRHGALGIGVAALHSSL